MVIKDENLFKRRAIFFDRDGVINRPIIKRGRPYSPNSLKKFILLPNVKKTIEKLNKKFLIIIISNQPEVARGNLTLSTLKKINTKIKNKLKIHDIYYCTHDDLDKCKCRKPKIGMLIKAKKKWKINFRKSFLVGDRWNDMLAGKRAKCKTIYLDRNYNEIKPKFFDYKIKNISKLLDIVL